MGKVKRLELWWQLYVTWLPFRNFENFRPMDFCSTEFTCTFPPSSCEQNLPTWRKLYLHNKVTARIQGRIGRRKILHVEVFNSSSRLRGQAKSTKSHTVHTVTANLQEQSVSYLFCSVDFNILVSITVGRSESSMGLYVSRENKNYLYFSLLFFLQTTDEFCRFVLCDVTPCSLVNNHNCFEGVFFIRFHGRIIKWRGKYQSVV